MQSVCRHRLWKDNGHKSEAMNMKRGIRDYNMLIYNYIEIQKYLMENFKKGDHFKQLLIHLMCYSNYNKLG